MFVVHAHPNLYQRRSHRAVNPLDLVLEHPQYSRFPNTPALVDPVDLARARYMHALDEQRAAREAYAVHHLRAFQDEAAAYLRQQQRQQQQALIAREEARQRALHARRQQIIQARREEELRRRRQEREENEFAQALILAYELAHGAQPAPVERAPVRPRCTCSHAAATPTAGPANAAAPRPVPHASSVPVVAPPPRPTPAPQPRVRFSPPQTATPASAASPPKPAATPVVLKSVLKPTPSPAASPASVRIPIRESKGKASSHVRINVTSAPPVQPTLSPADAIAALMLLEADLDALRPATTSSPLLKHQLNTILESVDAIESGGHDAVRDVRRALVQRIEEALGNLEHGEAAFGARPQRATGITINEPASSRVEAGSPSGPPAVDSVTIPIAAHDATTPPTVVDDLVDVSSLSEAEAASVSAVLPEGYVVDDFLVPDALTEVGSVVLEHSEGPATSQPAADSHLDSASAAQEPSDDATALAAEPGTSPAAVAATVNVSASTIDDSTSASDAVVDEPPTLTSSTNTPSSPAPPAGDELAAERSTPATTATGHEVRAMLDGSASATLTSRAPSPAVPDETPLAASYPLAQTFAAPIHPTVDAGSDGEWERASGSEGEKSDYEVL